MLSVRQIEALITSLAKKYGGFYAYDKAIALSILTQNSYNAFRQVTTGDLVASELLGWTFFEGTLVSAAITSEASNGAGSPLLRIVTPAAHNLTSDHIVCINKANVLAHDKKTRVSIINGTTFDCTDIPYVSGAGASTATVNRPAYIKAATGSAGTYSCGFSVSFNGVGASSNGKRYRMEINQNVTDCDWISVEQTVQKYTDIQSMSVNGNIVIADGDKLWISFANLDGVQDINIKHLSVRINRI